MRVIVFDYIIISAIKFANIVSILSKYIKNQGVCDFGKSIYSQYTAAFFTKYYVVFCVVIS